MITVIPAQEKERKPQGEQISEAWQEALETYDLPQEE
jgi:hypothetical protein